jgi:hypothetical protein
MNKTSMWQPTISVCCAIGLLMLASSMQAQAAGGAFAVDDSEVGKPGECKVESWVSFADNHRNDFIGAVAPACVANLGRPVELGVQVQRTRGDGEWGTGLTLKAKTNLIPLEGNRFGLGISGSTGWDLITGENVGGAINLPLTFEVSEQVKVNFNAGWLHERADSLNWFTWGAGFEWNIVKPVTLIAEVFGQAGNLPPGPAGQPLPQSSIREPRLQAGLRYTPVESIDLDLIYGRNITGEDANWITLGLNVRF